MSQRPVVTVQPSDVSVNEGGTAQFSVTATVSLTRAVAHSYAAGKASGAQQHAWLGFVCTAELAATQNVHKGLQTIVLHTEQDDYSA